MFTPYFGQIHIYAFKLVTYSQIQRFLSFVKNTMAKCIASLQYTVK